MTFEEEFVYRGGYYAITSLESCCKEDDIKCRQEWGYASTISTALLYAVMTKLWQGEHPDVPKLNLAVDCSTQVTGSTSSMFIERELNSDYV